MLNFEVYAYLFKFKEGDNFRTTGIHGVFRGLKFEPDAEIGQKGVFLKGLTKKGLDRISGRLHLLTQINGIRPRLIF